MKRTLMAMALAVIMVIGSFTLTSTPVYASEADAPDIDPSDMIVPSASDEYDNEGTYMVESQMLNIDQIKSLRRSKAHKNDTFYADVTVDYCSSEVDGETNHNYLIVEVNNYNWDTGEVIDTGIAVLHIPDKYVGLFYPGDDILVKAKLNTKLSGNSPVLESVEDYLYY